MKLGGVTCFVRMVGMTELPPFFFWVVVWYWFFEIVSWYEPLECASIFVHVFGAGFYNFHLIPRNRWIILASINLLVQVVGIGSKTAVYKSVLVFCFVGNLEYFGLTCTGWISFWSERTWRCPGHVQHDGIWDVVGEDNEESLLNTNAKRVERNIGHALWLLLKSSHMGWWDEKNLCQVRQQQRLHHTYWSTISAKQIQNNEVRWRYQPWCRRKFCATAAFVAYTNIVRRSSNASDDSNSVWPKGEFDVIHKRMDWFCKYRRVKDGFRYYLKFV